MEMWEEALQEASGTKTAVINPAKIKKVNQRAMLDDYPLLFTSLCAKLQGIFLFIPKISIHTYHAIFQFMTCCGVHTHLRLVHKSSDCNGEVQEYPPVVSDKPFKHHQLWLYLDNECTRVRVVRSQLGM